MLKEQSFTLIRPGRKQFERKKDVIPNSYKRFLPCFIHTPSSSCASNHLHRGEVIWFSRDPILKCQLFSFHHSLSVLASTKV